MLSLKIRYSIIKHNYKVSNVTICGNFFYGLCWCKEDIASVEKLGEGDSKFTSINLGENKILDKKEAGEKLLEEKKSKDK